MKQELEERIQFVKEANLSEFNVDFPHADIIDSRDIQERIDELQTEFENLIDAVENAEDSDLKIVEEELETWLDVNGDEYVSLVAFKNEAESYTSEWDYGNAFISDGYFEDYARELAEDIGAVDKKASWPNQFIDWNAASEALKIDYSEIIFDDVSYWVRG